MQKTITDYNDGARCDKPSFFSPVSVLLRSGGLSNDRFWIILSACHCLEG